MNEGTTIWVDVETHTRLDRLRHPTRGPIRRKESFNSLIKRLLNRLEELESLSVSA